MAKTQRTTEKQEELVLLNDHKASADKLINKLNGEVILSLQNLGYAFESLEFGEMTESDFHDMIENGSVETSKRFRKKVLEDLSAIPSKKLKEIASVASEQELSAVIDVAIKLNQQYSKYFKYISFNNGEFLVSDSTIEEIYNSFKEYESNQASQLRTKHKAALDAVNEFFVMLKTINPNQMIFSTSLMEVFKDPDSSSKTPFKLAEINYQQFIDIAENSEYNKRSRRISDFIYSMDKVYTTEGTGRVLSIINKMKSGLQEERDTASSQEVTDFIEEMKENDLEKKNPKAPRAVAALQLP